jgi:hypothetical protein
MLCGMMSLEEQQRRLAAVEREFGPHAEFYMRVYANPTAMAALHDARVTQFPPGSIIAKEKLQMLSDAKPEGLGFMI